MRRYRCHERQPDATATPRLRSDGSLMQGIGPRPALDESANDGGNDELDPPSRSLRAIETVIVTDVALMRDGLVRALESHASVRVVGTAATPSEAVVAVSAWRPAVALLDMSCASALEIVSELRYVSPQLCVVAFSIGDSDEDLFTCVQAGIVGFVPKRGTVDDLVAACESATRGEAHCSPRIVAGLFRRLATLASSTTSAPSPPSLSPREMEIIELIDRGLSNKAIAQQLTIGLATVKNHVHNILEKLHVTTRGEAVALLRAAAHGARNGSTRASAALPPITGRAT